MVERSNAGTWTVLSRQFGTDRKAENEMLAITADDHFATLEQKDFSRTGREWQEERSEGQRL